MSSALASSKICSRPFGDGRLHRGIAGRDPRKGTGMSRRVVHSASLVIVLLFLTVRPVSAQDGFWRWIERLSGPGGYQGWGATLTPICVGVEKESRTAEDPDRDTDPAIKIFPDLGCGKSSRNHFRAMLRFEVAWLTADDNPLVYDPPRTPRELRTRAFSFIPAVDIGITRWLEAGAGIGFIRFSGDLFDGFSKPAIQAIRLTAKPLLFLRADDAKKRYGLEFLQVRYIATVIPDGFEAHEFGAVPGTFSTGTEFLSGVSFVVDVLPLVELVRR